MDRLSFLKKLGVGVAAAVITPKILTELPAKEWEKQLEKDLDNDEKEIYGHYEENWQHRTDVNSLRLWDLCCDKDMRIWACTAKGIDSVELTALKARPLPNYIEIKNNAFGEYFVIISSTFHERRS